MRTAAHFHRYVADGVYLDDFAVFIAKKSHCAAFFGFFYGHFLAYDGNFALYRLIYQIFRLFDFFLRHGAVERKVKPQAFRRNVAAALFNFLTQNFAKACLQQVRRSMQKSCRLTAVGKTALKALPARVVAEFLVFCIFLVKTVFVYFKTSFLCQLRRHFYGKTVSVVKAKRRRTVNHVAFEFVYYAVELFFAADESAEKLFFFLVQLVNDSCVVYRELRIYVLVNLDVNFRNFGKVAVV